MTNPLRGLTKRLRADVKWKNAMVELGPRGRWSNVGVLGRLDLCWATPVRASGFQSDWPTEH